MDSNPQTQKVNNNHLWILLPRLPIQLWSEEILMNLANHMGKFIHVNKEALYDGDKRMTKVMKKLNIEEG